MGEPSPDDALQRLEHQLERFAADAGELYRHERSRVAETEAALHALGASYLETVRALAAVVEAKDPATGRHLGRCRVYGAALMHRMGLDDEHTDAELGFLLHDLGQVGVPDAILGKPGPLTAAEWRVMRTHPTIGHQIVSSIPMLGAAAEIVRTHHETWDGSGYPDGLRGEEIPVAARAFGVIDAFDAMTTTRPYREALSVDRAASELTRMAGVQFDPEACEAFVPMCERLFAETQVA